MAASAHDGRVAHRREPAEAGGGLFETIGHLGKFWIGTGDTVDAAEMAKPVTGLRKRHAHVPRTAFFDTAFERRHHRKGEQITGGVIEHLRRQRFRLGRTERFRFCDIEAARRLHQRIETAALGPRSVVTIGADLTGNGKPKPIVHTAFNESDGDISPDGRWLAYLSDESGRSEVYVQPLDGSSGRWQISNTSGGGWSPEWSADGKELFYLTSNGDLMVSVISPGQTFQNGVPRKLFFAEGVDIANNRPFSVTPDGQRFIFSLFSRIQRQLGNHRGHQLDCGFEKIELR